MEKTTDIKNWYKGNYAEFVKGLNGDHRFFYDTIRKNAIARFDELNFPTNKDEEWKYTNIGPLLRHNFAPSTEAVTLSKDGLNEYLYGEKDSCLLVFTNGNYSKELSTIPEYFDGIKVSTLFDALKNQEPAAKEYFGKIADTTKEIFTALNTAYLKDGAFIFIPDGKVIEKPIHLLFLSITENGAKILSQPRNLIVAGKHSQATIIEHYTGKEGDIYFTNSTTEVYLKEDAVIDHVRIQEESRTSFHIGRMEVEQERGTNFTSHLFSTGAELARNNFEVRFKGEGCESTLNGLYLISGTQLFDAHTMIDHAVPLCVSHEHYKGILDDSSRGVFNGKVMVRRDAQKTNAFQENNNVILSNAALVNTKPQLEIFADDVKCSHGATIGQLDDEALFYLKSRGIGPEASRSILLHAFASDVVRTIKVEAIRDHIEKLLTEKFEKELQ